MLHLWNNYHLLKKRVKQNKGLLKKKILKEINKNNKEKNDLQNHQKALKYNKKILVQQKIIMKKKKMKFIKKLMILTIKYYHIFKFKKIRPLSKQKLYLFKRHNIHTKTNFQKRHHISVNSITFITHKNHTKTIFNPFEPIF